MLLLDGAAITIRQDPGGKTWTATVILGNYSKTATATDPVLAIGLAVMLQAGYTEGGLKKALSKEASK